MPSSGWYHDQPWHFWVQIYQHKTYRLRPTEFLLSNGCCQSMNMAHLRDCVMLILGSMVASRNTVASLSHNHYKSHKGHTVIESAIVATEKLLHVYSMSFCVDRGLPNIQISSDIYSICCGTRLSGFGRWHRGLLVQASGEISHQILAQQKPDAINWRYLPYIMPHWKGCIWKNKLYEIL